MPYILCMIGAALLAYCVFLISGVGIAITAFIGIMLIVSGIYWWFLQMRAGMHMHHDIAGVRHYELQRMIEQNKHYNRL